MVTEWNPVQALTTEEIFRREHVSSSSSRKVVDGPVTFATHATEARTISPVVGSLTATSASISLAFNKVYRFISSQAAYFRLSLGTSTAVVGDIYLPADKSIVIRTGTSWNVLSAIRVSADGVFQVTELV